MKEPRPLFPLVVASLLWNLVLVASVALGDERFSSRVAGGGFDQYPVGLRIAYLPTTILTISLIWFALVERKVPNRFHPRLHLAISILFSLSLVVNLASPSEPERFNAIPTLLIAVYFLARYRNHPRSTSA
ncbi:MAG: hypothetical protein ACKO29_00515 [Actinomycetota bacterium]